MQTLSNALQGGAWLAVALGMRVDVVGMYVGAVCVHEGVGCCWGGAVGLHSFCLHFREVDQRLGLVCLFFFFLILTSQSLLLEQLLSLQLLWESMLLTELSRSCR